MGYAEKVPEDRIKREIGNEWYIPHHGIYHSRKPDKIRVVFDCSATYHGISLNSQLLSGPDLTSNLIGVLLRFRQENIAFMGGIESMFYQVQVPEEDRDYLRFLWWEDGDLQQEPTTYRMKVHLFGAVSSPSCSNAALRKTADVNQEFYDEEVVEMIKKNFYVDDCLKSAASEERAVTLIHQITSLCQTGGFRLTKWISNSHTVLDSILPEERAKGVKHLDLENSELPPERALGVFWEVEKDILGFKVNLRHHMDTKRGILATMSSVYDPIGLLSPFLLTAKSLLQTLCCQNVGWDDKIEGDVLRKWTQWKEDLLHIEELHVMRSYKPRDFGPVRTCELHMFSDASDIGYGVVAYLRLTNNRNEIHCSLVFAKSRVAPLKKVTVPRMELTAATLSVRFSRMIVKELDYSICAVFYWTDSMPVIRYIANEKTRFHTFVANRIEVIREASDLKQWKYIETSMNPADIASRGARIHKFLQAVSGYKDQISCGVMKQNGREKQTSTTIYLKRTQK
ncbi:uncharacterized protein [Haliotis asinina]|uniref:uncharacterized protein n=1 Tax=Haliotis asinina TaxID=109174 RepID=UPI003531A682